MIEEGSVLGSPGLPLLSNETLLTTSIMGNSGSSLAADPRLGPGKPWLNTLCSCFNTAEARSSAAGAGGRR